MDGYLNLMKDGKLVAFKRVKSNRDKIKVMEFWKKTYGKVVDKCETVFESSLPVKDIVFKPEKSSYKKGSMMKTYKAGAVGKPVHQHRNSA